MADARSQHAGGGHRHRLCRADRRADDDAPDFGGAILFAGVWFVAMILSGIDMKRMGAVIGVIVALTATYFLYDNARHRIDSFIGGGTAYDQVDGGTHADGGRLDGRGLRPRHPQDEPARSAYRLHLQRHRRGIQPGACALIVLVYLAIVGRVLMRLLDEEDLFALLAGAGLIALLGGQAFINIWSTCSFSRRRG